MEEAALKSSWIIFRFTSRGMKPGRRFLVLFARFLSLSFLSVPQYDRGHFVSGAQSVETFDYNFSSQEKVYQLIGTVYQFQ